MPGVRFAVAYGSHARGRASARSDLDLLYVFDEQPAPDTIRYLVARVLRLHAAHGLTLDSEVAYAIKLWTTRGELHDALSLAGFTTAGGEIVISTVPTDPAYLNSPRFKARLILNALTSPHVFLGGDGHAHQRAARAAIGALTRLAVLTVGRPSAHELHELAAGLISDPVTGASGQDWLGYQDHDGPHLYALLAAHLHGRHRRAQTLHRGSRKPALSDSD
nr:nucleotidyltransferase domain-containing protein [Jiangella mangrovi]